MTTDPLAGFANADSLDYQTGYQRGYVDGVALGDGMSDRAEALVAVRAAVKGLREAYDLLDRSQREQNVYLYRKGMEVFGTVLAAIDKVADTR